MAWFVVQTLVEIVLAFVLGLLVGWLWWRRRKVHFGESEAVAAVTTGHRAELAARQEELDRSATAIAEKDLEIGRLSALVSDDAEDLAERHEAELAARNAELAELTARLEARDAEVSRLAGVIDEGEAGASALRESLAARDAEIADHETALAAVQARLAERDAEIARLSAAAEAAAATAGPVADAAPTEPTEPATERIAALATPVERTAAHADAAPEPAPAVEPEAEAAVEPEPEAEAAVQPEPETVDLTGVEAEAAATEPDELERVEGIGPRIGAALRGAGITSFRQLADADTATLQGALEQAGLRFAPSLPTWSRQAALLAAGDEAGFVRLTESLVAGRDISGSKR